jgi:hypothetical protein
MSEIEAMWVMGILLAAVLLVGWACYHEGRCSGYCDGWEAGYKCGTDEAAGI